MKILTVATQGKDYYAVFVRQCAALGLPLTTLGWGEAWRGFNWKLKQIARHLETLPEDEVVVVLDAYDVIPLAAADTVMARFLAFKRPIVMSTELEPTGLSGYMHARVFPSKRDAVTGETLHLNAGAYMGYAGYVARLYRELYASFDGSDDRLDDQRMMMHLHTHDNAFFRAHVAFDVHSTIFLTVTPGLFGFSSGVDAVKDAHFVRSPTTTTEIVSERTGLTPCFVHGPSSANLDWLLAIYGIQCSADEQKPTQDVLRHYGKMFEYSQYFWPEILVAIFIIAIIVVAVMVFKRRHDVPFNPSRSISLTKCVHTRALEKT